MPFTDDDLRRLKMRKEDPLIPRHTVIILRDLQSLLARLEAAEWVVQELERMRDHGNDVSSNFDSPLEAWRKAAGKEPVSSPASRPVL